MPRKAQQLPRTERILSLIKKEARLQTELEQWLKDNPGGNAKFLLAQIGEVRKEYRDLMTPEERAAADKK